MDFQQDGEGHSRYSRPLFWNGEQCAMSADEAGGTL